MKSRIFFGVFEYLSTPAFMAIILALLTRKYSANSSAVIATIMGYALFAQLFNLGMASLAYRKVASEKNDNEFKTSISVTFLIAVSISFIYSIILFFYIHKHPPVFFKNDLLIILFVCLTVFAIDIDNFLSHVMRAHNSLTKSVIIDVFIKIFSAIFIYKIDLKNDTIYIVIFFLIISIMRLSAKIILLKKILFGSIGKITSILQEIRAGIPLNIINIIWIFANSFDRFSAPNILEASQVTFYYLSVSLLQLLFVVPQVASLASKGKLRVTGFFPFFGAILTASLMPPLVDVVLQSYLGITRKFDLSVLFMISLSFVMMGFGSLVDNKLFLEDRNTSRCCIYTISIFIFGIALILLAPLSITTLAISRLMFSITFLILVFIVDRKLQEK